MRRFSNHGRPASAERINEQDQIHESLATQYFTTLSTIESVGFRVYFTTKSCKFRQFNWQSIFICHFFIARRYSGEVYAVILCLSVCLCDTGRSYIETVNGLSRLWAQIKGCLRLVVTGPPNGPLLFDTYAVVCRCSRRCLSLTHCSQWICTISSRMPVSTDYHL